MRKLRALLPLAVVVVLGMTFLAQAGGKGALKVSFEVAEIYYVNGRVRTRVSGIAVGRVIFSPTASGMMNVTVQVKDGKPETTFECYVIPPSSWAPDGDRTMVTLNKKGKGTFHLQVETPDSVDFIKVVMMNYDGSEPCGYTTDRIYDYPG
ncbi:MAG: hypothetical protein ACYTG3_16870 [Planctomycetota bacterium]|jgi:hypothetical protein